MFNLDFLLRRRTPLVLQSEAAECGLACLAMIAAHWGHHEDLTGLRRRIAISSKGTTLRALVAAASHLGLSARALKLPLGSLVQLRLPCVLHWDMNHFVVLAEVKGKRAVILDPGAGRREVSIDEISSHFSGVAVEFTPAADFRPVHAARRIRLRDLLGKVQGLPSAAAQVLMLGLTLEACAVLAPMAMQWLVDDALVNQDRDLVTVVGLGFLLLVALRLLLGALRSWVVTVMSSSWSYQWMSSVFAHLLRLPLPFFETRSLGDLLSRIGSLQTIQRTLTSQLVEAVLDGLLVIATLAAMLMYSPTLSAICLAAVAIYAAVRLLLLGPQQRATAEQLSHSARVQSHFLESAAGISTLRLLNGSATRQSSWMNLLAAQFGAEVRVARVGIGNAAASTLVFGVERVLVIWLAALAVMDARFTIGMLFAFLALKDQFSQRVLALVDRVMELRLLRVHGQRLADVLLQAPESADGRARMPLAEGPLTIELRDVCFRYGDAEQPVLSGVNLKIPAGQCVAITGPSGCGKTTLVKLLLGLLEPTAGSILINGVPLRHIGAEQYRRAVGAVLQDDHLFRGSIMENITFFEPNADLVRAQACATQACLHKEILAMPMGYDTLVGETGSGLSGGQRQRLFLARALYKQPRMLVLDEATSHLDIVAEQAVNSAIRQLALSRLVIAHRPETIASADRVVVLQGGCVVQDVSRPAVAPESPARARAA